MRKKPYSDNKSNRHYKKSASNEGDKPRRSGEGGKEGDNSERKPFKRSFGDKDRPKRRAEGESGSDKRRFEDRPFKKDGEFRGKPKREFGDRKKEGEGFERKPFKRSFDDKDRPKRRAEGESGSDKRRFEDRPFKKDGEFRGKPKRDFGDRKKEGEGFERKPFKRSFDDKDRPRRSAESGDGERKPFKRSFGDKDRPFKKDGEFRGKPKRDFGDRKKEGEGFEGKPFKKSFDDKKERPFRKEGEGFERKPFKKQFGDKPKFKIAPKKDDPFDKPFPLGTRKVSGPTRKKFIAEKQGKEVQDAKRGKEEDFDKEMTLNKYIAHSGECSRRDAAELVKQGKVKVNGELVLEPGYRVKPEDKVTLAGKKLKPVRDHVYLLLNKPKGFITTTEDPQERKTVMDLVANAGIDRLYPVGRLDRNTTGLLLITNDGDLAQKLSHPSYEVKKVYQVTLDKPLTKADFEKIIGGLELEDGAVKIDALSYLEQKNELGIELHSGRNRVVRRIFESLGYEVQLLDRVMYAGLTKKNLPRSKWRFLNEKEIILLKHFKS
jgi:23S rRNA pseudouridine2605 synthase